MTRVGGRAGTSSLRVQMGESMRQYIPVITLALLGAFALAVVSGGLFPSDNAVLADHIPVPTNIAPVFPSSEDGQRSIAENSPAGVNIEAPIAATDEDGDTLTYTHKSLNQNSDDADSFEIDQSTGQLITKLPLNYESGDTPYLLMVNVDDGRGGTQAQVVTIMVTNVDEQPAAPAAPVVTTSSVAASLELNWFPPENTGPDINDYDYRYKMTTETSWTVVENGTSTATTAMISSLEADTAYQVSVRATSGDEGDSPWSLAAVGSTNKEGNAAPEFASATADRSVAENTPSGQRVGAAITATDDNSTTLNYSLAGAHASLFDIEGSTGQIKTKEPLNTEAECRDVDSNHLTTCTYMVLVVVDDDGDGGSDVIAVTISVTDVSERPSQPAAPTVEMVEDDPETDADESTTSLKVSWVAPDTSGPPIDDYDLEWRKGTTGAFTEQAAIAETSYTITNLDPNSSYQVRVTANSDEQNSLPSLPGSGSTEPSNKPPVFSISDLSRDVDENTEADRNIGRPITATESDRGDTLTYSLVDPNPNTDGDHEESFDIDEGTGQLKTKAALDHEATSSYTVTVTATDQKGETDTIEITITVEDVDEPPSEPSKPTVTVDRDSPTDTLHVTWTAPNNEGKPQITEYEVRYRASGSWNSLTGVGTNTSAEIENLNPFTNYNVEVRAINAEGESRWVSSSELTSKENNELPSFASNNLTREVPENTAQGLAVGDPVTAEDADDDTLEYSLGGTHADLFDIDESSGQIKVKEPLNYEAECGDDSNHETQCNYTVDVKVIDGNGGSHSTRVTITVTDNTSEAPSTPSAPTVSPAEPTDDEPYLNPTTMLEVSWAEPLNEGPSITQYAVQYKVSGGNFQTANIVFEEEDNAKRSATITGLDDDTSYQVQVRATNREGDGSPPWTSWSPVGTGSTRFANTRPEFSRDSYDLSVDENTTSGRNIGRPVDATDDDGHRLTYTLEGVHKDQFTIVSGSGHIRTRASLDYESRRSYSLTVRATDTEGASAAVSVTIEVDDKQESPTRPGAPTVSGVAGSTSDMRVAWDAPSNDGRPRIVDYDVQYREVGKGFKPWHHDSTDTSTIITDLSASKRYEVQVKAWNMEDESEWSLSGRGSPEADPANNAPVYTGGTRSFTVVENSSAGVNIGTPVTATDADDDDLSYSLEGADSASFEIVSVSGQIQTKADVDYNYEATKNSYSVTVRAADDRGGSATVAVTIAVTDVRSR